MDLEWLFGDENVAPLALSVGGWYAQQKALRDAQDRRRQALAQMLATDQRYGQQAQQTIGTQAQQFSPTMREPARQAAEDTAYQSLNSSLVQARENPVQTGNIGGKVSPDFLIATARRTMDDMQAGADRARMMAKVRSTSDQGVGERIGMGEMGSELGAIGGNRQAALRTGQMNAETAGQPSGGLMLAGNLARLGSQTMLGQRLAKAIQSRPAPGSTMLGG